MRSLNKSLLPRRLLLLLLLALPAWLATPAAYAQQGRNELNQFTRSGGISLEQASATVRRATGGRVLQVKPVNRGGQRGFDVRVLIDDKRVKQYYVDSQGRMSPK